MSAAPNLADKYAICDVDAERALLGAFMLAVDNIDSARAGGLEAAHFADPRHQVMADMAFRLRGEQRSVDPLSLTRALGPDMTKAIGGHESLVDLMSLPPLATADVARNLAALIVDLAKRRKVVALCQETIAAARDMAPEGSAAKLIEWTSKALFDLDADGLGRTAGAVFAADAASKAVANAWAAQQSGKPPGLALGLDDLDSAIGGAHAGDLIVVGGRPGMGKSALAVGIARNVAKAGQGVIIISCEMTHEQIGRRLVSDQARDLGICVTYHALRAGRLDEAQKLVADQAAAALMGAPLIIDDRRKPTLSQIHASVKLAARKLARQGVELGLIVVDHMQLVASPIAYKGNRTAEITEISGELKALARDMGVPIIVCSQLNRDLEGREVKDKRPTLRDLRESGAIEQDADIVLLLFREEYYLVIKRPDPHNEPMAFAAWEPEYLRCKNRLEVIIAKNREGDPRTVLLHCDMSVSAIRTWRGRA
jgi:replicative DNA helicase